MNLGLYVKLLSWGTKAYMILKLADIDIAVKMRIDLVEKQSRLSLLRYDLDQRFEFLKEGLRGRDETYSTYGNSSKSVFLHY